MRVVGGRLKGRNLAAPSSQHIRPTADRLRESLFNILIHAYDDPVADARVLDLNDKPIAGLYAAGSTVGGLDGGPHAGYVGGLIKATIGLRAAETIAGKS